MSTTVDLGKITASVTVGTTTTGAAGTNASVSNSGTTQDAVLNFTIPRGAQGVQGPQGSTGPAGPAGPTGPQGPMGDVAVITPEQQAAFTMYSVPGQNTDGPMTQKAVTDNLVASAISYDNSQSGLTSNNVQGAIDEVSSDLNGLEKDLTDYKDVDLGTLLTGYINSNGTWSSTGGHWLIPVQYGEKYRLKTTSSGTYYAWLSGTETTGTPSYTNGATKSKRVVSVNEYVYITVPNSSTNYLYLVHYISGTYYDPTSLQRVIEIKERLEGYDNINVENVNYPEDTANDFVISDENNNDIVQFRNGHIKTSRFDSAQIDLKSIGIFKFIKSKYEGLRCAIVGDSISTYSGTMPSGYSDYYPHGDVTNVGSMWWKIICNILGMSPVNCSWSGSRVTGAPKGDTAFAACSDLRIADMGRDGNPDVVIFFIGCNDWGNDVTLCANNWSIDDPVIDDSQYSSTDTLTLFCEAYSLMLYKTKIAYPHSRLFCCTILDEVRRDDVGVGIFPPINSNHVSNYTWNEHIRMISEAYGSDVINMHDCGVNYFNLEQYYSVDAAQGALHPNKAGQALMAQKVISELISK